MLTLRKLKLTNFLSHKSTELDFTDGQKLLIDGVSGSGKSSVSEAIVWALYGKGRLDNRSLVKHGEKRARVTLVLAEGYSEYAITRSITTSGGHELEVLLDKKPVGAAGIKALQEFIEKKILRASYQLFINSVVYPQENSENFVKQNAARRKDIILEIVNADEYDIYYERARKSLADTELEIADRASAMDMLSELLEQDKAEVDGLKAAEEKLEVLENTVKNKEAKLTELRGLASEMEKLRWKKGLDDEVIRVDGRKIKRAQDDQLELKAKLERLESGEELAEIEKQTEGLEDDKRRLAEMETVRAAESAWSEKYLTIFADRPPDKDFPGMLAKLNRSLVELMGQKLEICPGRKDVCPRLSFQRDQSAKLLEERINEVQKEKKEHDEKVLACAKALGALGDRPAFDSGAYQALKSNTERKERLRQDLLQRRMTLGTATATIKANILMLEENVHEFTLSVKEATKDLEKVAEELAEIEPKLGGYDAARAAFAVLTSELNDVRTAVLMAKSAVRRYTENEAKLKILTKEKQELDEVKKGYVALKEAFGQGGIKNLVIDYVIPRFEERINDVLSKLSDFRVRLDTQKANTTGDKIIEGLFISILNEKGEEFDFDGYSGGEKLKIIVAISEALSEIQNTGFRILDELFIGLDDESTEKFAEIILTLQERFSQLICISHLKNIKAMFGETIKVTKTDGTSRVTTQ